MPPDWIGNVKWTNGLIFEADGCALVDPWSNYYHVRFDTDGDGQVANPNPEQIAEGRLTIKARALVWSAGEDGLEDTWEDNPLGWE